MKYEGSVVPIKCMQTHSSCYQGTTEMAIKGVLWHSTGANNPNIRRYVQPYETDADYIEKIQIIGYNSNRNDWNHVAKAAGLNAWIGKLADGSVSSVQSMPWNLKPWGCGSGSKGSCNNGWIQFEICEDDFTNKTYFEQAYTEACELTAYLCKRYNIDPCGTILVNGQKVPTILCHHDAYKYSMGSGHVDVDHWFPKFGKSMETAREDVCKLLNIKYKPVEFSGGINLTVQVLKKGSKNDQVKALQALLTGYSYNVGDIDGIFGQQTYGAVYLYQQNHSECGTPDGIVGEKTWNSLMGIA